MKLSVSAEQKLRKSLIETLERHVDEAIGAFYSHDGERLKKIGHALRGNSGGHYFGLHQLRAIGRRWEEESVADRQFDEDVACLRAMIEDLRKEYLRYL